MRANSIEDLAEGLDEASTTALMKAYEDDQQRRAELAKAKVIDSQPVIIGGSGFPGSLTETAG